jgi:hypothetical protein
MIPRLANRTPRTRAVRVNAGDPRLESLAAEFALLAQRRSRAIHQLETLDQQRATDALAFARLQKRINWLMEHMSELSAELAEPAAPEPEPVRQHPQPGRPNATPGNASSGNAVPGNAALAAIGRKWAATQPAYTDHHTPPRRTKRP